MKFFTRNIISSVTNMARTAGIFSNKTMGKTVCGFDIEPEGVSKMWGTPGFVRAVYAKHNAPSKIHAEQEFERIKAAGGEPKTEVTMTRDNSRWSSEGIITHEYTWSTKDGAAEIQNKTPEPRS